MSNNSPFISRSVSTAESSEGSPGNQPTLQRSWLWTALVSGIIGFLCFVGVPFLPVHQTQSSVSWPQQESLNSIQTPLISYAPVEFRAEIPLSALTKLNQDQSLVVGTLAQDFVNASKRGFFVRVDDKEGLDVSSRGQVLLSVDPDTLQKLPSDARISVNLTEKISTVNIPGAKDADGNPLSVTVEDEDFRPDVMGVYSELTDTPENYRSLTQSGLSIDYTIDSRFSTSPTLIKSLTILLGLVCLLIAFSCLYRFDSLVRTRQPRLLPSRWWKFTGLDWIVTAILLFWYVFGANTSDDGFILTMSRAAPVSGYMANYYRWYGVPEAPFGFPYYNLLEMMSKVSTSPVWTRLPALLCAFAIWFIISRYMLQRLGKTVAQNPYSRWAAAFGFLTIWLPYNNGLRPEPLIALGALVTWACFERAIATSHLFPASIGLLTATLTLGAGPTGLIAVGAFFVLLLPLLLVVKERVPLLQERISSQRISTILAAAVLVVPFLPVGTAILAGAFGDQTFASVMESVRVRDAIGPSYQWFDEVSRYSNLVAMGTADGSFARRFGVLILGVNIALILVTLNHFKIKKGISNDVAKRMLSIVLLSLLFLMFTPTKWTHHFGIFAGIAGPLAALAILSLGTITARSMLNRFIAIAAALMVFAFSLAGTNGWWYISSWKVPWWDKAIQFQAHLLSNGIMYLALLIFVGGVTYHAIHKLRGNNSSMDDHEPGNGQFSRASTPHSSVTEQHESDTKTKEALTLSPIIALSVLTVSITVASMGKAFVSQYPAYTVGLGNLRALTGNSCQLAHDVLLETNTNDSFLTPIDTSLGNSLNVNDPVGFSADSVPTKITWEGASSSDVAISSLLQDINSSAKEETDSTEATTTTSLDSTQSTTKKNKNEGVNGSHVPLPFGLDSQRIPVMGSWSPSSQKRARLTSAWFEVPQRNENQPLMVVSAAGYILHHDMDGVELGGAKLSVEYATLKDDGSVENAGELEMMDLGQTPQWRNLRLDMDDIPESANVVRLRLEDFNLGEESWVAITPPRVPILQPMTTVIGKDNPTLLDWTVGFQFPCQRPFGHHAGVAEAPRYRITPGIVAKDHHVPFQSEEGGGLMGVVDPVSSARELPSYLNNDWMRDWGTVEVYTPRKNSLNIAPDKGVIDYQEVTRSGVWSTGHMKTRATE